MAIFKLTSYPIEQIRDLQSLEWRLGQWAASISFPWRLLVYSRPFDMQPVIQRVRGDERAVQQIATRVLPILQAVRALVDDRSDAPHPAEVVSALSADARAQIHDLVADIPAFVALLDDPWAEDAPWTSFATALASVVWALPWLKDIGAFYEDLGRALLRSVEHYIVTWDDGRVPADALRDGLASALQRPVVVADRLPTTLTTDYTVDEQAARIVPDLPGHPHLAVLRSYDMGGSWDATTLHRLLDLDGDVAIAIDVQTLGNSQALRGVELAVRTAQTILRTTKVMDPRAERVVSDGLAVMHRLDAEALHLVQIAVLVAAETPLALSRSVMTVRDLFGSTLRMQPVAGAQGELIKLWSTTPATQIDAPWRRYTVLSHGVGCCLGLTGYHRAGSTSGLLWGIDRARFAPLFYDLFADNQAAHMVILGKTGYGKTFFLNITALRAAVTQGWRVIMLDAFENAGRVAAAGGAGVQANWIDLASGINILDIVFDEDTRGGWQAAQVQYSIGQFALLLGVPGVSASGKRCYVPRQFSIGERGVLDLALSNLYAQAHPNLSLADMPRLPDLIVALGDLGEPEADVLANDLQLLLFGTARRDATTLTSQGRIFASATTIDWNFSADINNFDLSAITEAAAEHLPFYYAQAIGAINRFMRDPARDRTRKTLLIIDEFGYASQVEAVARMAADICKVARKFGIGLLAVDQNPHTFLASDTGREIWDNSVAKMLFHLDDRPAREVGEAISDLTPGHIERLPTLGRGEAVAIFRNDVYDMVAKATARELHALTGS